MIPFFRKIRKTLADDNKPLKYIRYAIGEIVLVVVGILIALSINNWNEKRVRTEETKLRLSNLVNDLEEDQKHLNYLQDHFGFTFHALQYLFEMANVDPYHPNLDDIVVPYHKNHQALPNTYDKELIQVAFKLSQQVGVQLNGANTYNELKSTGQFSYIPNDDLKDQINGYYGAWEWSFDPIMNDLKKRWLYSLDKIGIMESNPFAMENPLSVLTNDPERAAILRRLTREIGFYAMSAKSLLEANTNLIKSIKAEIAQ